ncbi:MAG TPA: hypothetical protein VFQ03_13580 [Candidatus Binatia bacterium]|nr:hypothetical protein [Candidatus Binatia bacterium]
MPSLTLAYRDDDRTPVIFAIRAMAARYYDLDVRVAGGLDDAGFIDELAKRLSF